MKKIFLLFICLFNLSYLSSVTIDFVKTNYIFFLNKTRIPESEIYIYWYDSFGKEIIWSKFKNKDEIINKYFKNPNTIQIDKYINIICIEAPEKAQFFKLMPLSKYVNSSMSKIERGFLYELKTKKDMSFLNDVCENGEAEYVNVSSQPSGSLEITEIEKIKLSYNPKQSNLSQSFSNLKLNDSCNKNEECKENDNLYDQ
ncbi:MAG: hypothetical protein P4L22_05970 [Candidatus Babeliales bacterium]|nr:hypothetical protein [Candidatus Babeliales bacterium]